MPNPTAAMVVIGDEILSGRTRDANMNHLATRLTELGIDLREVRVVSDDAAAIISALNALRGAFDTVFTSGGIGPTHDDITAECVAQAFGVPIDVREDAVEVMAAHYPGGHGDLTPARLRMARIPQGASLIENPVSGAPGFTLDNVHVLAGVPKIFQAMVESVAPSLVGGAPLLSHAVRIERGESSVAEALGQIAQANPDVSIGSYPFQKDGKFGCNIVVRSADKTRLGAVVEDVERLI
ncbi:MAG: molybdopterin-binding protein [Pseudomonadota bacterium]